MFMTCILNIYNRTFSNRVSMVCDSDMRTYMTHGVVVAKSISTFLMYFQLAKNTNNCHLKKKIFFFKFIIFNLLLTV